MESLESKVERIRKIFKTELYPVGIKIIRNGLYHWDESFQDTKNNKRFCYYVSRAAKGEMFVITDNSELDCYTPFVTLGFDEPKYANVQPRISPAVTKAVLIGPLHKMAPPVDTILFIVNPKQAMFLTAALRRISKKNIEASFGASMAICGDAIAHSVINNTPNISFLCGGARIFSEYEDSELIFAIPLSFFDDLYYALIKIEELQALESQLKKDVVN